MCGRATLSSPAEDVAEIFDALPIDIGPAKYNIAPSTPVVTVRSTSSSSSSVHKKSQKPHALSMMRWGLIPWWAPPAEAKRIASKCIQARSESVQGTPAFRDAFKRRGHRCLVVFDGFFEWKTLPDGRRIPHHIRQLTGKPFAVAGLWDAWRPPSDEEDARAEIDQENPPSRPDNAEEDGPSESGGAVAAANANRIETCAVVTTAAAGLIRQVHTRMPLILPANEWETWLEGTPEEAAKLLSLSKETRAARVQELVAIPVSTWVNSVKHDDPHCIEPTPIPSLEEAAAASQRDEAAGSVRRSSSATPRSGSATNKKGEQIGFAFTDKAAGVTRREK